MSKPNTQDKQSKIESSRCSCKENIDHTWLCASRNNLNTVWVLSYCTHLQFILSYFLKLDKIYI